MTDAGRALIGLLHLRRPRPRPVERAAAPRRPSEGAGPVARCCTLACTLASALVCVVLASPACAQDGGEADPLDGAGQAVEVTEDGLIKPSDAQLELNKLAVRATKRGQSQKALDLFAASLALGDLNVTWLNVGRLHASEGRCEAALAAFGKAREAPAVVKPTPEEIEAILTRYETELVESQCAAEVRFLCSPANLAIFLDGTEMVCPEEPLVMRWGKHQLIWAATGFDQPLEEVLQVGPASRHEVELDARPTGETSSLGVVGWTLLGVGAGATTVGLAIDLGASDSATNEHVALGLYIGGGAMLATGAGLLIAEAVGAPLRDSPMRMRIDGEDVAKPDPDEAQSALGVAPWIGPDGGGAALFGRF